MITRTHAPRASVEPAEKAETLPPWRRALREAVSSLDELLELLHLEPEEVGASREAARQFPLRVPRSFVARMRPGDPRDPLLLQVLPGRAELADTPGYSADPLGEAHASPVPGLLHKYHGRALLVTTGACAVHCRYCFRRHFPYAEHARDWRPALEYLARTPSIREVILSGGDPLSLTDAKLGALVSEIEALPHVERLRLHTRLPVVLPERIDESLCETLQATRLQTVVVVHVNHGNEIDFHVREAFAALKSTGATLLNQTVFLRNINDQADTLRSLSEGLFRAGVLPYYLHVLDRVDGASHFEAPEADARRLIRRLMAELPGYLVPKLVKEQVGASSKTPIHPFTARIDTSKPESEA